MAAPRKDNVKELILDAAEKLLESRKLSDISLSEIAQTAGISKGTLYYHYKSKNEILFDITDKYLDEQWNDRRTLDGGCLQRHLSEPAGKICAGKGCFHSEYASPFLL